MLCSIALHQKQLSWKHALLQIAPQYCNVQIILITVAQIAIEVKSHSVNVDQQFDLIDLSATISAINFIYSINSLKPGHTIKRRKSQKLS